MSAWLSAVPVNSLREDRDSGTDRGTKPDDNDQDNGTDEGKWDPNVNEAGVFPIVKGKNQPQYFIFLHPDSRLRIMTTMNSPWLEEKTGIDLEFEAPPRMMPTPEYSSY